MYARVALVLILASGPFVAAGDVPARLRVENGSARVVLGREVRALDPAAEALELPASAYVECGARSELALTWRGVASATLAGPAEFEVGSAPRLALARFQVVELEVRRGPLTLEVPQVFHSELASGAVQLRALANGAVEVLNRGGAPILLTPEGGAALSVAPGKSARLDARPRP